MHKTKEDASRHLLFMKKISMRKNIIIKGRPRAHLKVRGENMKKKLVSSIIFLSIIFFVGCQRSYTGNNKERENLKIEKKEK